MLHGSAASSKFNLPPLNISNSCPSLPLSSITPTTTNTSSDHHHHYLCFLCTFKAKAKRLLDMGKEYWNFCGGGKTSKKEDGGGEGRREGEKDTGGLSTGCACAMFQLFALHRFPLNHQQQSSNVLQPSSFLPVQDPPIPRGVEAPRNSLELEEDPPLRSSRDEKFNIPIGIQIKTKGVPNDLSSSEISSSPGTKTPNLVARLMGLDLLPDHLANSPSHSSSSTLGTPNLPPKSHSHNQHCRPQQPRPLHGKRSSPRSCLDPDFSGTRSLPETPRISSARRSDVEHRLSLQINKENVIEDLVLSRLSSLKRIDLKFEEESRSPGHYARQIVKQVKESVGRKFGLDITNTDRNREQTRRRDQELELISQYKSKKILSKAPSSTKIVDVTANSPGNHSVTTTSCSPRLKFLEPKNKPITTLPCKDHNNNSHSQKSSLLLSQNTKPSTKPSLPPALLQHQCHHHHQQRTFKKFKKVTEEKFGSPPISRLVKKPLKSSDIIRTNKEDPFVLSTSVTRTSIPDKKCKKIPLSSDLNVSPPTLLPVKKDPTPPATKIPQKQVSNVAQESKWSSQLSSCSSQSYKQAQATRRIDSRETNNEDRYNNGVATNIIPTGDGGASGEEYEYITRILKRTGLDKDTPVSFTRWFSPSHPLDPSSFYYLEHLTTRSYATSSCENNRTLDRRSNRKLLFDLVDEILVDILRPYINMKPWSSTRLGTFSQQDRISHMNGSHLVQMLCAKLRSFPRADCQDLKDIDGLIDKDLAELKDQNEIAFREEGERIVMDVEKNIMDTLIHETAMIFYGE